MPPGQSQPPLFSQSVQQFLPPPAQAGHAAPSLYPQSSMPITSGMAQPQTTAPSHGVSFSSSYTYAPSSFGLLQTSISMPPQFQPSSQMPTPVGPTETQPWMPSNGGTPVVASLQQGSLQAFPTSTTVPRPNGSSEGHQQMLSFSSPNTQHLTLPYYQHTSNAFTRNTVGWGAFHLGFPNTDPEQGRCRRTDGKKWRCSRDAVADQKYCERHMNRGRHRSRKLVEGQTGDSASATTTTNGKLTPIASATSTSVVPAGGLSNSVGLSHHHQLSNLQPSSNNHVCGIPTINRSLLDKENANGVYEHTTVLPMTSPKVSPKDNQLNAFQESSSQEFGLVSDSLLNPLNGSSSLVNCRNYGASDNLNDHHNKSQHAVRQFKDDWPKNQSECTTIAWRNVDLQPDRTQLSISIPVVASDFMSSTPLPVSEKLTSSPPRLSRELEMGLGMGTIAVDGNQRQTNWVPISLEPSMGGPLGEVLHTTSNSAGNCKNTKPLNLIDSWDSSPWLATSPTGVLQRGAFRFLSNSSAASSPRAESSKIHDGACLCDGLINPGLINSSLPAL